MEKNYISELEYAEINLEEHITAVGYMIDEYFGCSKPTDNFKYSYLEIQNRIFMLLKSMQYDHDKIKKEVDDYYKKRKRGKRIMKDLEIFKNDEFGEIRGLEINGEPYVVGKDIAETLGYTNPQKALRDHVDEEDKGVNEMDTPGGKQKIIFINESGVYSLIMGSKLPNAKKFKRWVTHEVLPTIRKHGAYMTPDKIEEVLANPDTIIQLAMTLKKVKEEKGKLQVESMQQKQIIGELKPKADYTDRILQNKSLMTMTAIAKDYGMSPQKLNKILNNLGVQFKQSGQWFLYRKYQDSGYTHSKTTEIVRNNGTTEVKLNTEWTQKGRLFLYELLKKNGLVPVIEKV